MSVRRRRARPRSRRGSSRRRSWGGCRPAGRPRWRPRASASATRSVISSSSSRYGRAAQVERERALGEGAEAALEGADVGVVDVAVAHEGDDVAHRRAGAGRRPPRPPAAPRGPGREKSVTISSSPTSWPRATPASTSATRTAPGGRARRPGGAAVDGSAEQAGGSSPPEHQGSSRARPSASEASSTGKRMAGSSQRSGSWANSG